MEYLLGQPLRSLRGHPWLRADQHGARCRYIARILADACAGLHAAHELRGADGGRMQVVHRDVSPQNLFVTFHGSTKVVDFGIARAIGRLTTTDTGTAKGTPAYMAPEQLGGHEVDRRADIWALGVVLWELLTGERLFRRDTPEATLVAVQSAPLEPPSARRSDVPAILDDIVLATLQRDRSLRLADAQTLGRRLHAFASAGGEPCGHPEVADWMQMLFPQELEQGQHQLQRARTRRTAPCVDGGVPRRDESLAAPMAATGAPARRWVRRPWVASAAALALVGAWASVPEREGAAAPSPAPAASASVAGPSPTTTQTQAHVEPASPLALAEEQPVAAPPRDAGPQTSSAIDAKPTRARHPERPRSARAHGAGTADTLSTRSTASAPDPSDLAPMGRLNLLLLGGWADVYLGERKLGRTPLSTTLPAGVHTLLMRSPDGAERSVQVTVPAGALVRQVVRLQ
jgi:serine/threonine-protein kinase